MTFELLKVRIDELLASVPDVECRCMALGNRQVIAVTYLRSGEPRRDIRIDFIEEPQAPWTYALLWSFNGAGPNRNCDGRAGGDAERMLAAVQHWIVDRRPWEEVPEFRRPPG